MDRSQQQEEDEEDARIKAEITRLYHSHCDIRIFYRKVYRLSFMLFTMIIHCLFVATILRHFVRMADQKTSNGPPIASVFFTYFFFMVGAYYFSNLSL